MTPHPRFTGPPSGHHSTKVTAVLLPVPEVAVVMGGDPLAPMWAGRHFWAGSLDHHGGSCELSTEYHWVDLGGSR